MFRHETSDISTWTRKIGEITTALGWSGTTGTGQLGGGKPAFEAVLEVCICSLHFVPTTFMFWVSFLPVPA